MFTVILLVALALATAYGLSILYPEATKTWFRRIMRFRGVLGAIGGVALALVFIGTGVTELVLIGFLALVYSGLYLIYEQPHKVIRKWIPI